MRRFGGTGPGRILVLKRLALHSGRSPTGRVVWALAFRAIARATATLLTRGERDASLYWRGSANEDFIPGLSDIDLAIVLAGDGGAPGAAQRRVRRRRDLVRRVPIINRLVDAPRVHEELELHRLAGASAFTFGLDSGGGVGAAVFSGETASGDVERTLGRPGLYGTTADWRLLAGSNRVDQEPMRDRQAVRIAAWLELVYLWRWVFPACADPRATHVAGLCFKVVAEAARIWLWLAFGERAEGRREVLQRAIVRLPEEEPAFRRALKLRNELHELPTPPLADTISTFVRLSVRIARLIATEIEEHGTIDVRLAGGSADLVVPDHDGPSQADGARQAATTLLPLADWRAVVNPSCPDECFLPIAGDPADPVLVGGTASRDAGPYHVLLREGLLVLPAKDRVRNRLRAVQCRVTDPVSFALLEGKDAAKFPRVRGWSAADWARRAVSVGARGRRGRGRGVPRIHRGRPAPHHAHGPSAATGSAGPRPVRRSPRGRPSRRASRGRGADVREPSAVDRWRRVCSHLRGRAGSRRDVLPKARSAATPLVGAAAARRAHAPRRRPWRPRAQDVPPARRPRRRVALLCLLAAHADQQVERP